MTKLIPESSEFNRLENDRMTKWLLDDGCRLARVHISGKVVEALCNAANDSLGSKELPNQSIAAGEQVEVARKYQCFLDVLEELIDENKNETFQKIKLTYE